MGKTLSFNEFRRRGVVRLTPNFIDLEDCPPSYVGFSGDSVRVKIDETGLEFVASATIATRSTMWQQIGDNVFLMQSIDGGATWFQSGVGEFDLDWPPTGDVISGITGGFIQGGTATQRTAWAQDNDGNVHLVQSTDNGLTWFLSGEGDFELTWPT